MKVKEGEEGGEEEEEDEDVHWFCHGVIGASCRPLTLASLLHLLKQEKYRLVCLDQGYI